MLWTTLFAFVAPAAAIAKGFNYDARRPDGAVRSQADFELAFNAARSLTDASGFTSARLFTTIQGGTTNEPISAIPAAIKTNTNLLLGLWCSGGDELFNNEIIALQNAVKQYGDSLVKRLDGISVGSEDLYRSSPIGIKNGENPGARPDVIAGYIKRVRDALSKTAAAKVQIGHVDTWTAWVDGANKAVTDAVDFVGMDAYPYFQDTVDNSIGNANKTFYDALKATDDATGNKPVWVTETGWPVVGPKRGNAEANFANAERYWNEVQCSLSRGGVNTWWYTLNDGPIPLSFSVLGGKPSGPFDQKPLYDLKC